MKKYLLNKNGDATLGLLFVLVLCLLLVSLYKREENRLDAKRCKQIRITDPQTEETIEFYGTNVQTYRFGDKISYTDNNGKEYTLNISHQGNSILEIEVVDKEFCK